MMPNAFRYAGLESFAGWKVSARRMMEDTTYYYVRPASNDRYLKPMLEFKGPLFGDGASTNVRVALFAELNAAGVDVPTTLTISGLHDVTLDDIIPEPDERKTGYVTWRASSWRDRTADQSINLRGTNRTAAARAQFWLFVVATLIGVAVSVAASSIQTLLTEYEQRAAPTT